MGTSNAYLVANKGHVILIDAGMKKKEQKTIDTLQRMKISPRDIKLIILTHVHYDHCGSLRALKDITRARILVHEAEAACLTQGYCEVPQGTMWFSKALSFIGRTLAKKLVEYDPVAPDITISERFDLQAYGIEGYILPTPGHTTGSISVIIEEKHAIVGDTLDEEVIWQCTTCGACTFQCPVGIEHVTPIIDTRRGLTAEGNFPSPLKTLFKSLERQKNPWGYPSSEAQEFLKENNYPQYEGQDVLYWMGCFARFDER